MGGGGGVANWEAEIRQAGFVAADEKAKAPHYVGLLYILACSGLLYILACSGLLYIPAYFGLLYNLAYSDLLHILAYCGPLQSEQRLPSVLQFQ